MSKKPAKIIGPVAAAGLSLALCAPFIGSVYTPTDADIEAARELTSGRATAISAAVESYSEDRAAAQISGIDWWDYDSPELIVPADHDELMAWLYDLGGFSERDIAATCGMVQNEGGNCGSTERMKLVWCVLDRLSHPETAYCGKTLYEQIAYPGQFDPRYVSAAYTEETRADVENVLTRWVLGYVLGYEIERELPEGYVWYTGDLISTNYFRNHF